MKLLDQLNSDSTLYRPRQICFLKEEPRAVNNHCENLIHGVVCASSVYHPPLKDFNGDMINEGNLTITSIHSQYCCKYVGERTVIIDLRRSFLI